MKKFFVMLLIICVLLLFNVFKNDEVSVEPTPTSDVSEEVDPETATENEIDDADDETDEDLSEDHDYSTDLIDSTYGGVFAEIEGDEDFIKAFVGNEIDENYITQINDSTTVIEMTNISSSTASLWETEINYIYSVLMQLTDYSEEEQDEQTAWANDLSIVKEEIIESTAESGSSGKVDAGHQIMEIYRNRAIELYAKVYYYNGTVEFSPNIEGAVG